MTDGNADDDSPVAARTRSRLQAKGLKYVQTRSRSLPTLIRIPEGDAGFPPDDSPPRRREDEVQEVEPRGRGADIRPQHVQQHQHGAATRPRHQVPPFFQPTRSRSLGPVDGRRVDSDQMMQLRLARVDQWFAVNEALRQDALPLGREADGRAPAQRVEPLRPDFLGGRGGVRLLQPIQPVPLQPVALQRPQAVVGRGEQRVHLQQRNATQNLQLDKQEARGSDQTIQQKGDAHMSELNLQKLRHPGNNDSADEVRRDAIHMERTKVQIVDIGPSRKAFSRGRSLSPEGAEIARPSRRASSAPPVVENKAHIRFKKARLVGKATSIDWNSSASLDSIASRASLHQSVSGPLRLAAKGSLMPTDVFDRKYRFGEQIGRGGQGQVYACYDTVTFTKVAVKKLTRNRNKSVIDVSFAETIILSALKHENIVSFIGCYADEFNYLVVMERLQGPTLADYVRSRGKGLKEATARQFFHQLVKGVMYLHDCEISHRDLKLENVVFAENGNLKIIDFGISVWKSQGRNLHGCGGTPGYRPPEVTHGKSYFDKPVDVWLLGVCLYRMLVMGSWFGKLHQPAELSEKEKGTLNPPFFLSRSCKELLKAIIVVNPRLRLTIHEISRHGWTRSNGPIAFSRSPYSLSYLKHVKSVKDQVHEDALKFRFNRINRLKQNDDLNYFNCGDDFGEDEVLDETEDE